MSKRLTFIYVNDINGKKKRFPKNPSLVAFFRTAEFKYYIYAACTKVDYSNAEVIEVSEETYTTAKSYFGDDSVENFVADAIQVYMLLNIAQQKYDIDTQTIGQMLQLS